MSQAPFGTPNEKGRRCGSRRCRGRRFRCVAPAGPGRTAPTIAGVISQVHEATTPSVVGVPVVAGRVSVLVRSAGVRSVHGSRASGVAAGEGVGDGGGAGEHAPATSPRASPDHRCSSSAWDRPTILLLRCARSVLGAEASSAGSHARAIVIQLRQSRGCSRTGAWSRRERPGPRGRRRGHCADRDS